MRGSQALRRLSQKMRVHAEPMPQSKGHIAHDRAFAVDDLGGPVRRHIQLTREFGRRDRRRDKLLGKDFSRVYGRTRYSAKTLDVGRKLRAPQFSRSRVTASLSFAPLSSALAALRSSATISAGLGFVAMWSSKARMVA